MSTPPRARRWSAVLALPVLALAACGSDGGSGSADSSSAAAPATSASAAGGADTLTVFAAASLTKTFTELGSSFEKTHPGTKVAFDFGGSSGLVTQLSDGAPGDVFASADQANMDKATKAGLTEGAPTVFAKNTLTIVTPPGNPDQVTNFASLAKPGLQVVVCAPQVPCGSATEKIEKATGVTLEPVSQEQAVTDVLGKVTSGQADAGLVYVTDAKGAGDKVTAVPFPEADKAVNTYPVAALKNAKNPALAKEFVTYVAGPEGRSVLSAAGFAAP